MPPPLARGFAVSHIADHLGLTDVCPGVTMAPLAWTRPQDGSPAQPTAALVWFEPGARLAGDHHIDSAETNYILHGQLDHAGHILGPGDVLSCARGTTHSPSSPEGGPGAVLYVEFPDRRPGR